MLAWQREFCMNYHDFSDDFKLFLVIFVQPCWLNGAICCFREEQYFVVV